MEADIGMECAPDGGQFQAAFLTANLPTKDLDENLTLAIKLPKSVATCTSLHPWPTGEQEWGRSTTRLSKSEFNTFEIIASLGSFFDGSYQGFFSTTPS